MSRFRPLEVESPLELDSAPFWTPFWRPWRAFAPVGFNWCSLWLALLYAHIRYPMADYPHPTHGPSFAMILGGDGYNALNDYAAYLSFHVACYVILVIPLLVMDTAAFTRSSALLRTAYSADLVRERHPASPVAAQVAYIAMLAGTQTWAIHMAMDTSYATWHMWHCGRRAAVSYTHLTLPTILLV